MGAAVGRAAQGTAGLPSPSGTDPDDGPRDSLQTGRWCTLCELGECGEGVRVEAEASVTYTITTFTGTEAGAGTDANVYVMMVGHSGGRSPRVSLDDAVNVSRMAAIEGASLREIRRAASAARTAATRFESGSIDTFQAEMPPFGELTKIRIGHDNSGLGPGWFLSKVVIERTRGGPRTKWVFPCERWLHRDEDDAAIERELTVCDVEAPGGGLVDDRSLEPAVAARASCTTGPSIVLSKQSTSVGLLAWSIRSTGANSLICIGAVPADCKALNSTPPDGAAWCVSAASGMSSPLGGMQVKQGDRFRVAADLDHGSLTVMSKAWSEAVGGTAQDDEAADNDGWELVAACDNRLRGEVRLCVCLWGGAEVQLLQEHNRSFRRLLAAAQKRQQQQQLEALTHATFGLRAVDRVDETDTPSPSRALTVAPDPPAIGAPGPRRATTASSTSTTLTVFNQAEIARRRPQHLTDAQRIERLTKCERRVIKLKEEGRLQDAVQEFSGAVQELLMEKGLAHRTTLRALSGLDTLMVLGSLASSREQVGDLHIAEKLWADICSGWHQTVGPQHMRSVAAFAQARRLAQQVQRDRRSDSGIHSRLTPTSTPIASEDRVTVV